MKNILLLFSGVILFIALVFFRLDLPAFTSIVSERLSWTFYTVVAFAITVQLALRSVRFRLLFNNVIEEKISLPESFLLTSASYFVALATPNKIGDMVRGLFAKGRAWEITAVAAVEYLFDMLVVLTVPAFGLFFFATVLLF